MNEMLQRLMTEATRLTRSGKLHEATQAIQRALKGALPGTVPGAESAAPTRVGQPVTPPVARASEAANDPLVLDGLTRVIDSAETQHDVATDIETDIATAEKRVADAPREAETFEDERWIDGSFTHQGRTLAYKLYLPPAAAGVTPEPRPMVVMLHGCTQGPADFAAGTQMNALARDLGVVVVYPEQTQRANAQKCWNWFKPQHQQRGRGEPAVLAALAQSITAEHHVDAARVFVAGLSAGGAMADIVGRCYPDVFAAVGVHSGLPSGSATDLMSALAAMRSGAAAATNATGASAMPPTIVFHGDADATVHVSNGAAIFEAARTNAEAAGAKPSARVAEGRSSGGQRYTRTVYTNAAGRSAAEYWQLHGAGHAWSGGSARGSYTDPSGIDASAEMMRFFLAHARA
ncbi:PHB depolymerase family esterase [Variovorax sp. KK3]|uniref:extracellular catalytic domain type 1 short-chain-length polyhydroxyalkanoate depolymerase n=1 Tax=Variovorax sp. KK3 TaxID=1855728 RepID=UPI00097BBFE0|nr:PHB depolymerase family esterase [Variovorax sp. KK3]